MNNINAAIYVRGFGMAEDAQIERCKALAARHGFHQALLFREGDAAVPPSAISARPALLALKAAVERNDVTTIFCSSWDRLTRDRAELRFILSWATGHGAAVRFVINDDR